MRIGVVGGAGKIGKLRVETIQECPDTTLAAVLDLSEEAARRVAGGAPVFTDPAQFFETEMDAVVVSTPPHTHEDPCITALQRGMYVLVEKPMANNVETCRRILETAKEAGRVVATGFNMRYYPAFAYVKDAVTSGKIGDLTHVRAFGGHDGLAHFTHDWEYRTPIAGGGAMWDIGIHLTDLVRHLLGEVTSVYGVASESVWNLPGSEDNAMAVFKNPEGLAAIYQATWDEWRGYDFVIEAHGTHGMVQGAYAPMKNTLVTLTEPGGKPTTTKRQYFDIAIREKLFSWKSTAKLSFAAELQDFLKLCSGDLSVRIADGNAGLRSIEIANAVAESTRTGQAVDLPVLEPVRP
ncbi:Gfo/Idh/MocA family oxidoreductase [Ruegeria sp. HKCCD4884]|uniref:Gfo/Idh/MocA family protein n=1 Tax=Ruegeria sp. HKCCD4884 TaxID=2683022 RepID=UPI001490A7B5|nr:Gfo/Idh/MocA family oxidoreductase [Ruegeria sp. HKCCD4884]NOD95179.1 Gfo/Idh/MocA family oxidoreductase [Ruegeria sp. HKCCD4884]